MSAEKTKLNGVQRMVKGSDLLVRTLEEMGVRTIYGLPGEENLDIMESIRNSKKIEFEGTRHEQSAIYMAATSGRLTGQPGVCMATCAPGSLNFCNGDLAPKFYPVLSSLQRFLVAVFWAVAA
ncbi:TPP-dependent 2-oxoacid decarboxylase [Rhizobium leguminosarum]